jgi:hypothetical protein
MTNVNNKCGLISLALSDNTGPPDIRSDHDRSWMDILIYQFTSVLIFSGLSTAVKDALVDVITSN